MITAEKTGISFLILLLLCLASACKIDKNRENAITPSGRFVTIGIVGPMTGPDDPKGQDGLRGIKSILHNQPLLDNGDRIKIVIEDDQNEVDMSVRAFEKLVKKDKVAAVLILSTSNCVLEINKIVDKYNTPVVATIASHPEIAVNTRYMTQLCVDNEFQGRVAALFARDELLVTSAAVFENVDSESSVSLAQVFKTQFIKLGGKVEGPFLTTGSDEEIKEQLLFLKQLKTELIYLPVGADKFISISKILAGIPSWNPVRMGSDGLLSTVLAKYVKDRGVLNDVIGIDFYSRDASRSFFGRSLAKIYLSLFTEKPNTFTVAGAEGIALYMDAMNRCKDPGNGEQVNEQVRKTDKFKGFIGRVAIDSNGKSQRPLIINTIKDGDLRFLVRVH